MRERRGTGQFDRFTYDFVTKWLLHEFSTLQQENPESNDEATETQPRLQQNPFVKSHPRRVWNEILLTVTLMSFNPLPREGVVKNGTTITERKPTPVRIVVWLLSEVYFVTILRMSGKCEPLTIRLSCMPITKPTQQGWLLSCYHSEKIVALGNATRWRLSVHPWLQNVIKNSKK